MIPKNQEKLVDVAHHYCCYNLRLQRTNSQVNMNDNVINNTQHGIAIHFQSIITYSTLLLALQVRHSHTDHADMAQTSSSVVSRVLDGVVCELEKN